jgi:predicted enzyme related to lactoylglutathione lyase
MATARRKREAHQMATARRNRKAGRRKRKPAIKVRAVDFVMYNVPNMKRAQAFYHDVLGLPIGGEYNKFWSEYATEPVVVALNSPDCKSKWFGPAAVALAVEDIHAAIEALRRRGVKILMDPIETGVCYMAFIADPDGNRICIHQRKDGTAG